MANDNLDILKGTQLEKLPGMKYILHNIISLGWLIAYHIDITTYITDDFVTYQFELNYDSDPLLLELGLIPSPLLFLSQFPLIKLIVADRHF